MESKVIGSKGRFIDDASFMYIGWQLSKDLDSDWFDDSYFIRDFEDIYPHIVDTLDENEPQHVLTLRELVIIAGGEAIDCK